MTPLKKYIWLVDTVMRAGDKGLTLRQITEQYERDENISGGNPMHGGPSSGTATRYWTSSASR